MARVATCIALLFLSGCLAGETDEREPVDAIEQAVLLVTVG